MANTGYVRFAQLEQYVLATGVATGVVKQNVVSDEDYIPPVYNTSLCPILAYYPITGCFWLQSDDDYEYQSCLVAGTETYYNTTGSDAWNFGDIVYEYVGGSYLPLSRDWDINTAVSYARNGVRDWVLLEGYTGNVINSGTCG